MVVHQWWQGPALQAASRLRLTRPLRVVACRVAERSGGGPRPGGLPGAAARGAGRTGARKRHRGAAPVGVRRDWAGRRRAVAGQHAAGGPRGPHAALGRGGGAAGGDRRALLRGALPAQRRRRRHGDHPAPGVQMTPASAPCKSSVQDRTTCKRCGGSCPCIDEQAWFRPTTCPVPAWKRGVPRGVQHVYSQLQRADGWKYWHGCGAGSQ